MNVGKTLFAQVMEYVPWKTFGRIVDRHGGDMHRPFMLVSFRRCCQDSMKTLFAMRAKRDLLDGDVFCCKQLLFASKRPAMLEPVIVKGVDHGGRS